MDITRLITYKSGGIISCADCSNHSKKIISNCHPECSIGERPYGDYDPNSDGVFNPIDGIIKHLVEIKSDLLKEGVKIELMQYNEKNEPIWKYGTIFKWHKQVFNNVFDPEGNHITNNYNYNTTDLAFAAHPDVIEYAASKSDDFKIINIQDDECIRIYTSIWNNSEVANYIILVTKKHHQPVQIS